jgi:hypothetical protein
MSGPGNANSFEGGFLTQRVNGQIGVETDFLEFTVNAMQQHGVPAYGYSGPSTGVTVRGLDLDGVFYRVTGLYDMGRQPRPTFNTGPFFAGGGWRGYVKVVPVKDSGGTGPSNPHGVTVGLEVFDGPNGIGGGVSNPYCLVVLPAPPPGQTKNVAIISGTTVKQGPVPTPFRVEVDGQVVYNSAGYTNPIEPPGGGWGSW